jgi:hypothetical protein
MTLDFWKATAERAVKTFAQALLALLGTGSVGITSLDWLGMVEVAATAAVASALTSLASLSTVAPVEAEKPVQEPWQGDGHGLPHDTALPSIFPAAAVTAAEAAAPTEVTPVFTPPAV